jgi:hypothetical protein
MSSTPLTPPERVIPEFAIQQFKGGIVKKTKIGYPSTSGRKKNELRNSLQSKIQ